MRFSTTLLAVRDMNRSLAFYKTFFDQDVVCDLGWNKTLTCGLALQLHFDKLCGFSEDKMQFGTHNMELYFETEELDAFLELLAAHPEVKRLHDAKKHEWNSGSFAFMTRMGTLSRLEKVWRVLLFGNFRKVIPYRRLQS